jgi:CRISPR-associated protein Csd1
MLDKENVNIGYLCGRLFAVQERVQEVSNKDKDYRSNIRIRFGQNVMTTPAVVFPVIENENTYHYQRIDNNVKTFFDLLKEEITSKIDKIPMNFNQIERGQFWIGYYHQRNSFFDELNNKKNESNN